MLVEWLLRFRLFYLVIMNFKVFCSKSYHFLLPFQAMTIYNKLSQVQGPSQASKSEKLKLDTDEGASSPLDTKS